jgi:hypothetical protein
MNHPMNHNSPAAPPPLLAVRVCISNFINEQETKEIRKKLRN